MSQSRDKAYWIVAIAALATFGGMMSARAQDGSPGASGYVEAIEDPDIIGGTDAEQVDSQEVQAQEALDGRSVENVSRFRSNQVEEIVVQARKRAELLEDTPVSVTALSENTLREAGITRLDQIQDLVPNLQVAGGLSGQDVQLRIRGVGTDRADLAFDPGVGVYVDGVFLPRAQGNFLDVLDVAQIEVLRGPQGTLFGKNTVGGAINMTTVKPGPDPEAFAFVRTGNFGTAVSRLSLNMPVDIGWFEDKLFSRLTVGTNNRRGYVYNALRDEYWSDSNSVTFLGSLRFIPVPELTIDLSGTWSNEHTHAMAGRCIPVREDAPLSGPTLFDACKKSNQPFRIEADTAQIQAIESYGTWMTATYDLPDLGWFEGLALKNLTSWREQIPRRRADVDNTSIPAVDLESLGGQSWARNGEPGRAQQISTELQLTGEVAQRLNFIAGYFVFWENADEYLSTLVQSPLGAPLPPPVGQIYLRRTTRRNTSIDNWTWALFTQATYDVFDWMSLTAGLRYTEDKKGTDLRITDPSRPEQPPSLDTTDDVIFTSWTPMGSIALRAPEVWLEVAHLDHLMAYFTYARGFKGGGFNAVFNPIADSLDAFGPETLDSFELGLKTIALEERLTLNVSGFYGRYGDIQVTSVRDLTQPGDEIPTIVQLTQNAAEATTSGAEIELLALPLPGLRLTGSVGILHTRYDSFPNAIDDLTGQTIDRSGQTFRRSPKLQTHVAAQYSFEVSFSGPEWLRGWLTPRIEWYYQSFMHFDGIEVDATNQPGYNLLHGRLSYDFMDDRAQIALWSRNLIDTEYRTFGLTSIAPSWGVATPYWAAPRTFGGELSYRF